MEPRPFIGLLILDVINRFIFGHGLVSYYITSQGQDLGTPYDETFHILKTKSKCFGEGKIKCSYCFYVFVGGGVQEFVFNFLSQTFDHDNDKNKGQYENFIFPTL